MSDPTTPSPDAPDVPPAERLAVVGVMGSGQDRHAELAGPLGRALAGLPVHLLTGGGDGVMTAVSGAFRAAPGRRGLVLGVLPARPGQPGLPREGYPNPHVEVAIRTHLIAVGAEGATDASRNHVNVLTSDVIVALPGGPGTVSEVALAIGYGRPVIAHLAHADELPGLPAGVRVEPDLARVIAFVREALGLG